MLLTSQTIEGALTGKNKLWTFFRSKDNFWLWAPRDQLQMIASLKYVFPEWEKAKHDS